MNIRPCLCNYEPLIPCNTWLCINVHWLIDWITEIIKCSENRILACCFWNKPHIVPYVQHRVHQPVLAHHSLPMCYQRYLQAKLYQQSHVIHYKLPCYVNTMHTLNFQSLSVVNYTTQQQSEGCPINAWACISRQDITWLGGYMPIHSTTDKMLYNLKSNITASFYKRGGETFCVKGSQFLNVLWWPYTQFAWFDF